MIPKVLYIGYVWPEPRSSAAGTRSLNLLQAFRDQGWTVVLASTATRTPTALSEASLQDQGILCQPILCNDSSFDQFLGNYNPDFVIFDRFVVEEQFGWRVSRVCPNAVQVIDSQDLHFLRRSRMRALKSGVDLDAIARVEIDFNHEDLWRELGSIYRSDLTLVISDFELELLTNRLQVPKTNLFLSRFFYHIESVQLPSPAEQSMDFSRRRDFVMIGNFRHQPNADAVLWLKKAIWPMIRKQLPQTEVHIYGAYPSREMMNLTDASHGFHVQGSAPSAEEVLKNARVSLAPLRFGAGIKGKIADSWYVGTPVVTTLIGSEGMNGGLPWGGIIGHTVSEFSDAAVNLYSDEKLWKTAQSNGTHLLMQLYDRTKLSSDLIQRLISTRENLKAIREENKFGAILNYHRNRSTLYFSKWIEAKNSSVKELAR